MSLSVGEKAPDFTLVDSEKKERNLNEFTTKKTVLAFYPGAFTGACTKEMCALRDSMSNLSNLNGQVVGISELVGCHQPRTHRSEPWERFTEAELRHRWA